MQASEEGKAINDELESHGILFYDIDSGINSFNKLIKDYNFIESSKKILNKFKSINSSPISKKLFIRTFTPMMII